MDTHDRILTEATRLFAEKGFTRASVREICEAAGVSKPVLYYHFESRDGLVLAVLDRVTAGFRCLARRHLRDDVGEREALVALMTALLDLTSSDRWLMRLLHRVAELPPGILAHLPPPEERERPMAAFLARGVASGAFAPDTDVRAVTWLLLGAFAHLATMALHHPRPATSRELAERLVAQALPPPPGERRRPGAGENGEGNQTGGEDAEDEALVEPRGAPGADETPEDT